MGGHSPHVSQQWSEVVHQPITMYKIKAEQIANLLDVKGRDYSNPDDFFVQLADVWSSLLSLELTPSQSCTMMIVFKACRMINNPSHEDTSDDLVGYSLILSELVNMQKNYELQEGDN